MFSKKNAECSPSEGTEVLKGCGSRFDTSSTYNRAESINDSALSLTTIRENTYHSIPEVLNLIDGNQNKLQYEKDTNDNFELSQQLRKANQLVHRYHQENVRLKDQLKSCSLREEFLKGKINNYTQEKLQMDMELQRLQALEWSLQGAGSFKSQSSYKEAVESQKEYIGKLEMQISNLKGKNVALTEAIQRKYKQEFYTEKSSQGCSEDGQLKQIACEALSLTGYLVKVVNAYQHIAFAPHLEIRAGQDSENKIVLGALASEEVCKKSKIDCTKRCLKATSEGDTESHHEILQRGLGVDLEELLASLREELLYCESVCVKVAAATLSSLERTGSDEDESDEIEDGNCSEDGHDYPNESIENLPLQTHSGHTHLQNRQNDLVNTQSIDRDVSEKEETNLEIHKNSSAEKAREREEYHRTQKEDCQVQ